MAGPKDKFNQPQLLDYSQRKSAPSNPQTIGYGLPHPQDPQHSGMLAPIHPDLPIIIKGRHEAWVRGVQANPASYNGGYAFKIPMDRSFTPGGTPLGRAEVLGTYVDEHRGPRTGAMTYVQRQEFRTEEEFKKYIEEDKARTSNRKSTLEGVPWEGAGMYMTKAFRFENNTGDGSYGMTRLKVSGVDPYAYLRAGNEQEKRVALAHFNPASLGLPENVKEQVAMPLLLDTINLPGIAGPQQGPGQSPPQQQQRPGVQIGPFRIGG